jgi:hypothetical protein
MVTLSDLLIYLHDSCGARRSGTRARDRPSQTEKVISLVPYVMATGTVSLARFDFVHSFQEIGSQRQLDRNSSLLSMSGSDNEEARRKRADRARGACLPLFT